MSYAVIQGRDRTVAAIIVVDEKDDGTVVVLQCEEVDDDAGVAIPSSPLPRGRRYVFGRADDAIADARTAAMRLGARDARAIIIDTTDMPPGRLEFSLGTFTKRLEGERESYVTLTPDAALYEWGWRRRELGADGF
ncbi:MAG TPA: hypothetical protein VMY78_10950 [Solirubrobacteraceae bacterium]|nr:hypothetical protein [Solirubrobacteraceae bacterium]